MAGYKLGEVEMQFAELIWEHEPVSSGELVRLCADRFHWKKSTMHTVLRRICEKGLFQNQGGQVTSLVSRADFFAKQSESFVEETFQGSLPCFLAAFTSRKKISQQEFEEIRRIIEENRDR